MPTIMMSANFVITESCSGGVCSWQTVVVASPVPSLCNRVAKAKPVNMREQMKTLPM